MSREKAIELLENIQSVYFTQTPNFKLKFKYIREHIDEVDAYCQSIHPIFPSFLEQLDKIESIDIPSKYQDPLSYYDIYEIFRDIENIKFHFESRPFSEKLININSSIPIFGTIPTYTFSACIKSADNKSDEFLIISDGLKNFAFSICSIIASFFPVSKDKPLLLFDLSISELDVLKIIKDKDLKSKFLHLVISFYLTKKCQLQALLFDNTIAMTEVLVKGFLYFTVAHEYSHFLLGHTSIQERVTNYIDGASFAVKSKQNELEADLFGAMLTETALINTGTPPPLSTFGINICLRAFDIIERLKKIDQDINDSTHPSYAIRRFEMDRFTVRNNKDYFESIDMIFDQLLDNFDLIVNNILNKSQGKKLSTESLLEYISTEILSNTL